MITVCLTDSKQRKELFCGSDDLYVLFSTSAVKLSSIGATRDSVLRMVLPFISLHATILALRYTPTPLVLLESLHIKSIAFVFLPLVIENQKCRALLLWLPISMEYLSIQCATPSPCHGIHAHE